MGDRSMDREAVNRHYRELVENGYTVSRNGKKINEEEFAEAYFNGLQVDMERKGKLYKSLNIGFSWDENPPSISRKLIN